MPTRFDVADRRIAERERELAALQYEASLVVIEANLVREDLHRALNTAAAMASAAREALSIPIDDHLGAIGRDLVG